MTETTRPDERPNLPSIARRSTRWRVVVIGAVGVVLSAALGLAVQHWLDDGATAEFNDRADRVERDFVRRMRAPMVPLEGVRALYAAQGAVTRPTFERYVAALELAEQFPSLRGIGFIEPVSRAQAAAHVAAARADGRPGYALRSLGPTEHDPQLDPMYVVRHFVSASIDPHVAGLDLGSEPQRREAIEAAIDRGTPTFSGPLMQGQGPQHGPGLLAFVPIYRTERTPPDAAARRAALVGLAYAPLVLEELIGDLPGLASDEVQVSGSGIGATAPGDLVADAIDPNRLHTVRRPVLSGQRWQLRIDATSTFEQNRRSWSPGLAALLGLFCTGWAVAWTNRQARRRAEAQARAEQVQAEHERLDLVARLTSNAVLITDPQLRITWVNDAFTRVYGHSREQAVGHTPGELLAHPIDQPEARGTLQRAAERGAGCRVEILNRTRDGQDVWVDTEVQPMRDAEGRLSGFVEITTDITTSRRARDELAASRERLAHIIDGTQAGTWEHDYITGEDRINAVYARMLGLSLAEGEALVRGTPFSERLHPDDAPAALQALRDHAEGRTPEYLAEFRMRHRDGHWVWIQSRGRVQQRPDGAGPRVIAGIHLDISERKQAEAALHEQQVLLDRTGRIGGVGGWSYDLLTREVRWTDQTCRIHGVPPGHRPGFDEVLTYYPGESGARLTAAIQRCLEAGEAYDLELPFVNAQGEALLVRAIGEAEIDDRGPIRLSGALQDITARRAIETEMARSAALLRGAIDTIDEAFVLYDPDDRLIFCNDKYRAIYAASADLIVPGARFEDIVRGGAERGQYPAAVGRVEAWVAERLAAHRASDTTLVQRLGDGRSLRIIERHTADGHTVGFRVDITELVRATEAAQAAATAKGQFLATISHEIRTPMNAILGLLTLLRRTRLAPHQADYALKIEGAARALLALLDDVLDFSKAEAGRIELDPQPMQIDQLLRDLSVILSGNVGSKPVEVLFDVDPALPHALVADALRLQQVLINLAGNALKFTARGEVVVAVTVLEAQADAVRVRIGVRDTGIGIAAENLTRIFSGFTQAEASTTRRFGGTGLGLAISQRLVALMGGELRVDSEPGHGSHFHFELTLPRVAAGTPAAAAPTQTPAKTPTEAPAARETMRVLVVDDHPIAREVLARMAGSMGWQVDLAEGGEPALARVQARAAEGRPYHAMFIDGDMPGMDGWETGQRIRALGEPGAAPIIVLVSGHGQALLSQRSEAERAWLDGFLVKPVTASMLFDAVADAHQGRQGRRWLATAAAGEAATQVHTAASEAVADRSGTPGGTGPAARLAGLRLLLVEDNPTNQQVACELLQAEGAFVTVASDGAAGVAAVAAADPPYDAVLMDVQMPVLDGMAATRQIRERLGLRQLPILAMTANALPTDRAASLAAGMNDHIGKPFDLDQLVRAVRRHTGLGPVAGHSAPGRGAGHTGHARPASIATAVLPPAVRQAATAARVDIDAALHRLGGRLDLCQRMLASLLRDLAVLPERLATEPPAEAGRALHNLKGLAATLGATALANEAAMREHLLQPGAPIDDTALAPATLARLVAQTTPPLQALQRALDAALAAHAPPPPADVVMTPSERAVLAPALRSLAGLLADSDLAALDAVTDLRRDAGARWNASLQALADAVQALDFARAQALSRDLLAGDPS